jgi:hypothetical protein
MISPSEFTRLPPNIAMMKEGVLYNFRLSISTQYFQALGDMKVKPRL